MPKTSTCERPSSHEATLRSTVDFASLLLKEEQHSKLVVVATRAATVFAERRLGGIETRILRVRTVGTRTTQ